MKKTAVKILSALLMLSMVFSTNVFAANDETTSAWDSFLGLFGGTATSSAPMVQYRAHIQDLGNMPKPDGTYVTGPTEMGTRGQFLRMEGFWLKSSGLPAGVHLTYQVHVQNEGWMNWVGDNQFAGTEGKMQRIEAIKIKLVDAQGNPVTGYSVQYKGHVQDKGDLPANDSAYMGTTGWYADGQQLGTTGSSLRLEALQVQIVATVNMTAYNAAVAEAVAVNEADYTAASYAALEKALIDNLVTSDNTQAEVDAATAAINAAIDALVPVPKVTSITAVNSNDEAAALTAVPQNGALKITFSEKVDEETVNVNTIKVYDADGLPVSIIPSYVTLDTTGTIAKVQLDNTLDKGDAFKVTVKGVTNVAGVTVAEKSADFTVANMAIVDAVTKSVSGGSPSDTNAAPVGTNRIVVDYDQGLDSTTVNSSTVSVVDVTTGNKVPLLSVVGAADKITITTATLTTNKQYKVILQGVKDSTGVNAENYTDIFAVGATAPEITNLETIDGKAVSTVWPNITSGTAADGTYYAGLQIQITFDQKLDASTVAANVSLVEADTDAVVAATVTYNADAKMVKIVPNADLKQATDYELQIKGNLKSEKGIYYDVANLDKAASTYAFDTLDITAPTIVSVTSLNGTTGLALDTAQEFTVVASKAIANFDALADANLDGNFGVVKATADLSSLTATDVVDGVTVAPVAGKDFTYKVRIAANNGDLDVNQAYKVVLLGKDHEDSVLNPIADASGNMLAKTYSLAFTTEGADVTAPKLVSVHKGDSLEASTVITSLTNVADNQEFTFEFDEALTLGAANLVKIQTYTGGKWQDADANYATVTRSLSAETDVDGDQVGLLVHFDAVQAVDAKYRILVSKGAVSDGTTVTTKDSTFEFIATDGQDTVTSVTDGTHAFPYSGVAEDSKLTITFAEQNNLGEVTAANLIVKNTAGTAVAGTLKADTTHPDYVFIFTPAANFASNETYSVEVSGVKDLTGNTITTYKSSFVTTNSAVLDVVSTSVVDGAINVATDAKFTVTFNQTVSAAQYETILIANVTDSLNPPVNVPCTYKYDTATKTATLTPSTDLTASNFYKLTIPNALVKANEDKVIDFTTSATQTDTTKPTVGQVTVVGSSIVVPFSEEMDSDTIIPANIKVFNPALNSGEGAYVTLFTGDLDLSVDGETLTITSALLADGNYTVVVTTGVKDVAGNALAKEFSQPVIISAAFSASQVQNVVAADATGLAGDGELDVTWNALANATNYDVTYFTGANAPTTVNVATNSATLTGLTAGSAYTITVTGNNGSADSVTSATATATPLDYIAATAAELTAANAPTLTQAVAVGTLQVNIDGAGAPQTFELVLDGTLASDYTAATLATAIATADNGTVALSTVANVTVVGGKIVITTISENGTSSTVVVTATGANAADVLTLTGFTAGQNAAGTNAQH